jgi:hypothetical protein
MRSHALAALLCRATLVLTVAVALPAAAQYTRDRSAREMIDARAINELYPATRFEEAEGVLLGIVEACADKCAPRTIARAWMYVGVVRGSGLSDQAGALAAFTAALGVDAGVALDAELASEATRATFERARQSVAHAGPNTPPASVASNLVMPPERDPGTSLGDADICPPGMRCAAEGDRCEQDVDCQSDLICSASGAGRKRCERAERCASSDDCARGRCEGGVCRAQLKKTPLVPKNWIGVQLGFDWALLSPADGLCSTTPEGEAAAYACYADRTAYPSDASTPASDTKTGGGFARGTSRLTMSYERGHVAGLLAGVRAGYVWGGAPQGFLPVHGEARLRYAFGLTSGAALVPHLFVAGGFTQVDARLRMNVADTNTTSGEVDERSVDAYKPFGRWFAGGGAGLSWLLWGAIGIDAALAVTALVPDATLALMPTLGSSLGW